MRPNPDYNLDDVERIRDLIRANPFVTIVTNGPNGLVASHYPVLVDDDYPGVQLLGHVGRPDDQVHEFGQHEVLVIVQGNNGYISSGWYDRDVPSVPTWNFTVAHLSGTPELMDAEENLRTLDRMVDFFEGRLPHPRTMTGTAEDAAYAQRISAGTVGFRIPITRFVAKRKVSQDKPARTVEAVATALESDGPFSNPPLAREMRSCLDEG